MTRRSSKESNPPLADAAGSTNADLRNLTLTKIPKTGELIARELRRRIVRGDLKAGDTLPSEAELMAQLSVSRASLREALRVLESESLVTVKRGSRGGPIVQLPDPRTAAHYFGLLLQTEGTSLEDVFNARQLIEPPAVRIVVAKARRQVPPSLQKMVDDAQLAVAEGRFRDYGALLPSFHDELVTLTGNKTLTLTMKILNIIFAHHITAIADTNPPRESSLSAARIGLRSIQKLLELIRAGDADEAVKHWRGHLAKMHGYMFDKDYATSLIDMV